VGREQAEALGEALSLQPISAVHCSPTTRAKETAASIAQRHSLPVQERDAIDEVNFGRWAGRQFEELAGDPDWQHWNERRSASRAPEGESMAEAQARAVAHVRRVALANPDRTVAMVSHCDIIRSIVLAANERSLDSILEFDIDPASITRLVADADRIHVDRLNELPQ
jgi:probable phosphoglycerate mutase